MGCTVFLYFDFRHGDNRPTNQPGDPRASLLLISVRRQSFAIPDVFGCLQYLFVKAMLICSKTQCLSYLEKRYQFAYMKENCLFVKKYVNLFVKEPNRKQTLLPLPAEVESANQISGTSHIANISSIFSKMVFTRCTMPGLNKNAVQTSCHKLGVH